jgi:hypothetical protein
LKHFPKHRLSPLTGSVPTVIFRFQSIVISTSEGFGLLGGAFVECDIEKYAFKCPECFKGNAKIVELYDTKANHLTIFDKKEILSLI